jgi:hypothetical protein
MSHSNNKANHTTEVFFDGEAVPMVPFVQDIICNVILGLVKTLHGFADNAEIKIVIRSEE